MKIPISFLAACGTLLFPLLTNSRAGIDTEPQATLPDMSLAFPFTQEGEKVVTTQDVLVNPGCLIPAGTVFLTIFVPPKAEDADVKRKVEKNNQDVAYSRSVQLPQKEDALNPAQRAAFERATRQPWKSQMIYRAAMKQYRFDEMRLVFLPPGKDHAELEAFNLPEGLFLGGAGGKVTVLAVANQSVAHKMGLSAGSTILKINGQPVGSLAQFQKMFFEEKRKAFDAGKALEITADLSEGRGVQNLSFAAPRKLGLNDFFSASDVATEPAKKPAEESAPDPFFKPGKSTPTP